VNTHLRNEIYLYLESNFINKEIPSEKVVSNLSKVFELSGFDAMMVYTDWTLEFKLEQDALDWERRDSEDE